MKSKEKMEKAVDVELIPNKDDQGELAAPLAEMAALDAQEMAQYQKERDEFLRQSKRKPMSKTKASTEIEAKIVISMAEVRALTNKKMSSLPDNLATGVAMRAMRDAARQEIRWLRKRPRMDWQEILRIAAFEGDDKFFKDLADSFRVLRKQGFSVDSKGVWSKRLSCRFV